MKDDLLLSMLAKADDYVSGEDISRKLGVTRAAVWKYIEDLRRQGYVIEAIPRRGYRLAARPDKLLPAEIRPGLNTDYMGQVIHYFTQIGSTQDAARKLAREGAVEGTIVVAEEQVEGRGRRGRNWISTSASGIFVSIVLRPDLLPPQAPLLTLTTAVAVAEAVRELTGLPAQIKWPNDILIRGRKISGILTEISAEMDTIFHVIIGIGINVNTATFPAALKNTATSLALEGEQPVSRKELLQLFLQKLERWYRILLIDSEAVLERWRVLSATLGRQVVVYSPNFTVHGLALDIDSAGALLIKTEVGEKVRIWSGDVSLR